MLILVICGNVWVLWRQAQPRIQASPELEAGYRRLVRELLIWANLPAVVLAVGILSGGLPSMSTVIASPAPANPFALAVHAAICWSFALALFRLFNGGAEFLATHPSWLTMQGTNPTYIKLVWSVLLGLNLVTESIRLFETAAALLS